MDLLAKIRMNKFWHVAVNDKPSHTIKSIIRQRNHNIGLWHDSSSHGIHWVAKLCILFFMITNITQAIALFMAKGDPKTLLSCFSILSFGIMGFLKLWCLHTKQEHWRILIGHASVLEYDQLNNQDNACDYESDGEEDSSFAEHISSYTKNFSSISTYLTRMYWFTGIVFITSPFIEYGLYSYLGKDIKRFPHILPVWAPLDVNALGYSLTILAEFVASVYCVRVHTTFDLTAIGYMIFIRGQFNLLHNYSGHIGGKGECSDLSSRRDNRAHFRIKKCHHFHMMLIKSVNRLDNLIQNILGIYFVLATFTLCSVAVRLKSEQSSGAQIISLVQYMGGCLAQLYLLCHYGDASSVGLGEGPSGAAFWGLSSKIRREIALLCVGMSRPCRLLAGPINSIDLPSFIQIIRTAYSYYAVLRQTTE